MKKINRKKLQALKFKATQQLVLGILMAIIATIPVALHWDNDCTGSLLIWMLAGCAMHDSIRKLVKLNRIG